MKTTLFALFILFPVFTFSQIVTIPDPVFKAKLLQSGPLNNIAKNLSGLPFKIDANNDGEIQVSEALQVSYLNVSNSGISSLTGVQSFTKLTALQCHINNLTSLDVSNLLLLKELHCYANYELSSLSYPLSGILEQLSCAGSSLTALNLSGLYNLKLLVCNNIPATSLDLSDLTHLEILNVSYLQLPELNLNGLTNLKTLYCSFCNLSKLIVKQQTKLEYLECENNLLDSLDITGLTSLASLKCADNQIKVLDLSSLSSLELLDCSANKLTHLDVTNQPKLTALGCISNELLTLKISNLPKLVGCSCTNNHISELDVTGLPELQSLECYINNIKTLDLSASSKLVSLDCRNNSLESLFIKNGTNEYYLKISGNSTLRYICADESQVNTIQALINQYNYSNCYVNTYCSFTPGGNFYYLNCGNTFDENSNGCDTADWSVPYFKYNVVHLGIPGIFISDTTGNYSIPLQTGSYTIKPLIEDTLYFSATPSAVIISLPGSSNPLLQHFCITPKGAYPDLEITIIPLNIARPGFSASYKIIYKNRGTLTQSGSVSLEFDDALMNFYDAVPSVSNQSTGKLGWDFTNLHPFESREIIVRFIINSPVEVPPVNNGDILQFIAQISGETDFTPRNNISVLSQVVVNSYDPNEKTCTEGKSISPDMAGEYVHYIIRFENKGTANAQNIVVKDVIDPTMFDINTLSPLSSSHSCVTRISNANLVEFIFQDIQLPFDDANNDGYIAFKIRTLPGLENGDTLSNSADIFFDYNAPITTNSSLTLFESLGVDDNKVVNSDISLIPNPTSNHFIIQSKNQIQQVEIFDIFGRRLLKINSGFDDIYLSTFATGVYIIKVFTSNEIAKLKLIKN